MSSAGPRDATAFEMREALAEPGCGVCRLALRSVSRFIASIAYEQVNDIDLREQLRSARGFCNLHAHQWLQESKTVLGTALIYRDVLNACRTGLSGGGRRRRGLLGGGAPPAKCPVCEAQTEAEARYLDSLLAILAAEPRVLEESDGLCRRHTLAAVRLGGPGAAAVLRRSEAVLQQMLVDLDEVIRKEDYRFHGEPRTEAERSVAARAIAWAAGADGLV